MEGIFLILIAGALFSQSWYVLGMYSEGRTMGIFVGGLGLLSLATIMFAPTLFITGPDITGTDQLAEITLYKSVILVWAVYTVGVAAHGLFDLDERAIGFYSAFLAVASLVPFILYVGVLRDRYYESLWLGVSASMAVLTVLAVINFFYMSFQFSTLRLVAGWFLLVGSTILALIGLAVVSTLISPA